MAVVVFYEKPGCVNNARQKQWLRESGHEVIEKSLLAHDWCSSELLRFFNALPVPQWFNPSAPRIKYGDIDPLALDAKRAIVLMLADPLLIRRPLMQVNESTMVGFDCDAVDRWIGLRKRMDAVDLEVCTKAEARLTQ